ncbi:MAG: hypothetical protein SFX73_04025 [Kofleriaceae bacterium]|nr:hypothetical protein [Kofleriaceae bacterium]
MTPWCAASYASVFGVSRSAGGWCADAAVNCGVSRSDGGRRTDTGTQRGTRADRLGGRPADRDGTPRSDVRAA